MAREAWDALIRAHGFGSDGEVAEKADMSTGHLSLIVTGTRDLRFRTAIRLARAVGCSLDELALALGSAVEVPSQAVRAG